MLGINTAGYTYPDIQYHEFLFFAIIGVVGGILGALYVRGVVFLNGHRRRMLAPRPKLRVLEAVLLSLAVFSLLFAVPFAFECKECTSAVSCAGGSGSGSGSGSVSGSGSGSGGSTLRQLGVGFGRQLAGGGTTLTYVRWHCPADTYNPMATLLHSGQEGLIKHMFERSSQQGYESGQDRSLDWDVVLPFLLLYMALAVLVFGIFVPSGNFIPAMTIGAGMGRLFGLLVDRWFRGDFPEEIVDVGLYALMGGAAVLSGVTRMTITLAVILAEVTDDAMSILPMMLVLTCAKFTGDLISPSFDHAMMHLQHLPFLEEEPPHEFDVLSARDVMARDVVVLSEVEQVGDLIGVLKGTKHNGFPIVDGSYFGGLILRRQLVVLLHERVWQLAGGKAPPQLSGDARLRFVDSAIPQVDEAAVLNVRLSKAEREAKIDLRPYMDPSPYVCQELMSLRRVYRLFNEIGVRHLVVADGREHIVGIITRKDILPENIEQHVLAELHVQEAKDWLRDDRRGADVARHSGGGGAAGRPVRV